MTATNERRGISPIRDHHDCARATDELGTLSRSGNPLSAADAKYTDKLREQIEQYLAYCPADAIQPPPYRYLSYLLDFVKPVSIETAASDTGIEDLEAVIECERKLTKDEAAILTAYFDVSPDAFDGPSEEQEP